MLDRVGLWGSRWAVLFEDQPDYDSRDDGGGDEGGQDGQPDRELPLLLGREDAVGVFPHDH